MFHGARGIIKIEQSEVKSGDNKSLLNSISVVARDKGGVRNERKK